jgi:hypothetical protein
MSETYRQRIRRHQNEALQMRTPRGRGHVALDAYFNAERWRTISTQAHHAIDDAANGLIKVECDRPNDHV